MATPTEKERDRIRTASRLIHTAAEPLHVLAFLGWGPEIKERFFAAGGRELPKVTYPKFDPEPSLEAIREARRLIVPVTSYDNMLDRHAESVAGGARMLAAAGTNGFFECSRVLFGEPTQPLRYIPVTSLELARGVHASIDQISSVHIDVAPKAKWDATQVAAHLEAGVKSVLGDQAPRVEIVDVLSANALASPDRIRVRKDACFTDTDAAQLLQHEAFVHVVTALNGRMQKDLPSLGDDHPATNRTQEGLAVLAELMSGTLELNRMRRLADRVVAIQMVIDGADFLQVYRYFIEQTAGDESQAFENTRRIFRGGVMEGGAPFTKDNVYLFGLLQTSSAIRAAFATGRPDCIQLMFCGKLDIYDVPALAELAEMGMVKLPRFLPPWVADPRYLMAVLTFNTFVRSVDDSAMIEATRRLLERAPIVHAAAA